LPADRISERALRESGAKFKTADTAEERFFCYLAFGQPMNFEKAELANIGPKEIRKRQLMGAAMLALGVVMAIVFARADVSLGWYAALFLPFWLGALALSQARKKT
jgi:hypothetical protein